jgi:Family of unknown function (DUF6493)
MQARVGGAIRSSAARCRSVTAQAALDAVERGDPHALAVALVELPETQRRKIAGEVQSTAMVAIWRPEGPPAPEVAHQVAQVALFGTCVISDLQYQRGHFWTGFFPPVIEVLKARPEKRVAAFAKAILKYEGAVFWRVVRGMYESGLIDQPDPEAEALCFIRSVRRGVFQYGGADDVEQARRFCAQLASDPAMREMWWTALRHEPAVRWMGWGAWADFWLAAVNDGVLDRARSLDEALDGLSRDFTSGVAALFRDTYSLLKPTASENAERVDRLTRILSAGTSTDQTFAGKILNSVVKSGGPVDGSAVVASVATPLSGTAKGAAMTALKLLDAVEVADVDRVRAAITGLSHPHAEVQGAVLKLIERSKQAIDDDARSELMIWMTSVAPEHRERVSELVGHEMLRPEGSAEDAEVDLSDLAARIERLPEHLKSEVIPPSALDRLNAGQPIGDVALQPVVHGSPVVPMADVNELVETLIVLLSGSGDPIDLERAIDGLARFGSQGVSSAGLSAVKRALPVWSGTGWGARSSEQAIATAAWHWCEGKQPKLVPYLAPARKLIGRPELAHSLKIPPADDKHWSVPAFDGSAWAAGLSGFVSARCWEAVVIGMTAPRPTLSLPTTSDGWIDGAELSRRADMLTQTKAVPGRFEAVQAIMRVHPDDTGLQDRSNSVVVRAARAVSSGVQTVDDEGLRRAAGRHTRLPHLLRTGEASGRHGYSSWKFIRFADAEALVPDEFRRDDLRGLMLRDLTPSACLSDPRHYWTTSYRTVPIDDRLLAQSAAMMLPRDREVVYAVTSTLLFDHVDSDRSSDCLDAVIVELADSDEPLGPHGHLLVAAALSSKNEIVGAAVTDVLVAASTDGRLAPETLGAALSDLTTVEQCRPARVAKRLSTLAREGGLVAEQTRRVIVAYLASTSGLPQDAHALLSALDLACTEAGGAVDDPSARQTLESGAEGGSKRATLARRLLGLEPVGQHNYDTLVLVAMIERAERRAILADA